jgi:hypothetical protein
MPLLTFKKNSSLATNPNQKAIITQTLLWISLLCLGEASVEQKSPNKNRMVDMYEFTTGTIDSAGRNLCLSLKDKVDQTQQILYGSKC